MSNAETLVAKLDAIGDAIRAKTGKSPKMTLDEMPTEIAGISGGGFDWSQVKSSTGSSQVVFKNGLETLDLTGIDTSKMTSTAYMFTRLSGLSTIDLSPLDTSSVTNMSSMFSGCSGLTSIDLSPLDTSSAVIMSSMFSGCSSLAMMRTGSGWSYASTYGDTSRPVFPVAMQDENGTQFAAGDVIPDGAHTYTATQ